MTTRTSRTPRTAAATRRAQLTAIAGALFARDGYHNVTVGDIAAAAGLSGPAIYRHFPGKQAILAEVVRSGFDEMAQAVAADLPGAELASTELAGTELAGTDLAGTGDPAARLHTTYRDLAAFVIRRPEFGVMWRREYRHLAPADAAELAKRMGEASEATLVEIRRLRPDLPPEDAELLSWAALSVLGSISDHRVRLPRAAFEELLAGMAMAVVGARVDGGDLDNRPQDQKPEPKTEGRREQLLRAAAQLFWDRGYHAVTLEEIGAEAGIAGPSIYSHFAGKTDLLRTITERIGERLRLTMVGDPATDLTTARAALSTLADRYVTTVLTSRDLVAAYFTEGHNLRERDRAETRRFQRSYTAHWAALLSAACPGLSAEEVRIRVLAAFAVVNDTARTRRLMDRPGLGAQLRQLMLAVVLTPAGGARDVNRH
ncbi:MAG: TetR/AcrR family transcriptional regulator [Catenulispora sp.]|nr:TetR/AcrR family transcriptional regulator [Catenulispora sp.]